MFTGIIDDIGTLGSASRTAAGVELRIQCGYSDLALGESIAVNGACLTVRDRGEGWFAVAAVVTTAARTTVGEWQKGRRLNLERAMRADGRFGGHIVEGHVDDVGTILRLHRSEDALLVDILLPPGIEEAIVPHGSVSVDGVSLTANHVDGDMLQVALIEYTLQHTTLGDLIEGDRVHLETDVIGKYVRRMAAPHTTK